MDYDLQNKLFIEEKQKEIIQQCSSLLKERLTQRKISHLQEKQQLLHQHFSLVKNHSFISFSIVEEIKHLSETLQEIDLLLHKISAIEECF